ncbi:hypothetical protein PPACK8108_LOCUS3801 [Phakopsora pachyrhizi]|uniref:Uncharacterized protein n=1 Tax=Phakopsora pachyrhizi TaxID=170000 RepID=A0AAV0AML6_PHAPC|nr:hypothetical protein PPACK8108_LOCUS3801 [Phakopsora pachyrhizi]
MSTSGKIETPLAAYQGNGVIEYGFASDPSTSQAGPYLNSKNPLKTFNKESTGRVESGEQEAEPGVEVQDDCSSPLYSLEMWSFSNSSLKPPQLPTRSNQFSLRTVGRERWLKGKTGGKNTSKTGREENTGHLCSFGGWKGDGSDNS